jgi:hypothetical protein
MASLWERISMAKPILLEAIGFIRSSSLTDGRQFVRPLSGSVFVPADWFGHTLGKSIFS